MERQWYASTRENSWRQKAMAAYVLAALSWTSNLALAAAGGELLHLPQYTPMIVYVDKAGQVLGVEKAGTSAPVDARIIRSTLCDWISDARLVTPDVTLQRNAVFRVYAHLSTEDAAYEKMNEWFNGTPEASPFRRSQEETVSTEILSCIQQSEATWQVDWMERTHDRKGVLVRQERMRALVTVAVKGISSSATEEDVRRNPLGIYVTDCNWARQAA